MELPPHTATGPITYGRRLPFALSELIELPPHAPSALLAEEWLLPTSAYKPAEEEDDDDDEDDDAASASAAAACGAPFTPFTAWPFGLPAGAAGGLATTQRLSPLSAW